MAQVAPAPNPDLLLRCPYNIILVLDESGSITGSNNTQNIATELRNGARDLINALVSTGSRVAVVEFNTNARRAVIGGSTAYQTVTASYAAAFATYIRRDNNQNPGDANYDPEDYSCQSNLCYTNWEAALNLTFNISVTDGYPQLVIFFTDGVPTAYINSSGSTIFGTNTSTQQQALQEAIAPANAIKNMGTHIFVVGIPNPNLPESNVHMISGTDLYPIPEGDFSKGDYSVSTEQSLQQDLADIAHQLTPNYTIQVAICKGNSFFAGGALQTQAGTYYDTLRADAGCDSIVITDLELLLPFRDTVTATVCSNEFYFAGGALQNHDGTFIDTFTAASNGCDSIVITYLTVLPISGRFIRVPICNGDSLFLGGYFRSQAGVYHDTFTAANGCDSILTTAVVIPQCDDFDACTEDYCFDARCSHVAVSCTVLISGNVRTETGIPVPGVTVTLSGSDNQTFVTAADGYYQFAVAGGGNYVVTPSKQSDVNVTNGISTLDYNLIRMHVLGIQPLASPYKIIAADANLSGLVSTLDVYIIRSVVLGNMDEFPAERWWQFVSRDFTFANPLNPFPFDKTRSFTGINSDHSDNDFIAIKTGDVTSSWNPFIP